ncbi:type II toxin-antitoxin system HicB family antitoxin [Marinospirillum sp.]|uniref:type II toxin-antitoxin system HicB family antitoxin n=1 Tax=Marinospirillum sp. TaxID=2183934 RepID=UPI003850F056
MYNYPVIVHQNDSSGCWLSCPDIPEFHGAGDTLEEALIDATDGMETALSFYQDNRRPIPHASKPAESQPVVYLPLLTLAKIELWNTLLEQGLRKADLARKLDVHPPQIDRLLDLLHSSKIEQVENALMALGKRFDLEVKAA